MKLAVSIIGRGMRWLFHLWPTNPKKLDYLEEIYYDCCLLGKYESKMQKGPGARYKNAVPSTIRTGCRAKWYAKKPRIMPNHWLIALTPKHNHKNFKRGHLHRSAKSWLKKMVQDGHSSNHIKKKLGDFHSQQRSAANYQIICYHY